MNSRAMHYPTVVQSESPGMKSLQAICMVLPQFHPIPENDEWWGRGFTEWTNVAKARPLYQGHYQPHLPADLGFYDLRVPETRAAQAALAREYGIGGFCYYHYWFNGRRLLNRPVDEILASGQPEFPFCLCWANENWTRVWDGGSHQVLLEQKYNEQDDVDHFRFLCRFFADERYFRVDGRPLFLVYKASQFPQAKSTVGTWRDIARAEGIGEVFLCSVQSGAAEHVDPRIWGFDAAVEFAPDWRLLGERLRRYGLTGLSRLRPRLDGDCNHLIHSYEQLMQNMLSKPDPDYVRFPCVTPMWDNASRRKSGATILDGSTPELYEEWLTTVVQKVRNTPAMPQICFINAWNEWAEGNHLEPCQRWGRAYLDATRRALGRVCVPPSKAVSELIEATP